MNNKNQELEKREEPSVALSAFLTSKKHEIAKIVPPGLSPEKVIKTAMMAAMDNPSILRSCSPASIYKSILQASLMGLTVGNGYNEGYLIPHQGQCTFRAGYRGWVKVAKRSPEVDVIRASVIYAQDNIDISEMPPSVTHSPKLTGERGECIGAVAVAYKVVAGGEHLLFDFTYMTREELDQVEVQANQYKKSPAWGSWRDEMRKKSVIRRLCKMLPGNEELDKLQAVESAADNGTVFQDPDLQTIDVALEEDLPPQDNGRTNELKSRLKGNGKPGKRVAPKDQRGTEDKPDEPAPSEEIADYGVKT